VVKESVVAGALAAAVVDVGVAAVLPEVEVVDVEEVARPDPEAVSTLLEHLFVGGGFLAASPRR
jgi:hypothetical protein